MPESFFIKLQVLTDCSFFYRTSTVAASGSLRFPACTFIKRLWQKSSVNFAKLQNEHLLDRTPLMTTSCIYLWILKSFSEHLFQRALLGNCLFNLEVAEFQSADIVKTYFIGAFQAYARKRSSHMKGVIYFKSLKFICEEVNL